MLDQCLGLVDEEVVESAGRGWAFIEMMGEADDVVGVGDFEEAFSPGLEELCIEELQFGQLSWPLSANG